MAQTLIGKAGVPLNTGSQVRLSTGREYQRMKGAVILAAALAGQLALTGQTDALTVAAGFSTQGDHRREVARTVYGAAR